MGEEEEEEVAEEEEEGVEGEVVVLSCWCRYQKILMEGEEETLPWPRPPPGGRNSPSHWPGRRYPSHASPQPIGQEQRWEAEGLVADRLVTGLTGDHGDGGGDDEDGSSL